MSESIDQKPKPQKPAISPKKPLSGFLNIHLQTGLLKSYKPKWFMFTPESGRLVYFKSKDDLLPQGHISISQASFTFDVKEKPGIFEIRSENETYVLEAKDSSEMLVWLQKLQSYRKEYAANREILSKGNCALKIASSNKETVEPTTSEDKEPEIPEIVVAPQADLSDSVEHGAVASASIKKMSQNMSKAAENAKSKLTSMFNRKSHEPGCENCVKLFEEHNIALDNLRMAREELEASQSALKMLHNQMNLQLEQISSLQKMTGVYNNPSSAHLLEEHMEKSKLTQIIEDQKIVYEKVKAHKESLEREVASLKDEKSMFDGTLKIKDEIIMSLSKQLEDQAKPNSDNLTHNGAAVEQAEREALKNRVEGYELQNKFLNKEILELHSVREQDDANFTELYQKHIELEAKYYNMQSKYLVVLNEIEKPKKESVGGETRAAAEDDSELITDLLKEAMQIEKDQENIRESLTSSLRTMQYDEYGFQIANDDIISRAVSSHNKSEQLITNINQREKVGSWRVKWENFLVNVDQHDIQRSQDFKTLVRGGIPREYREKVWNILINFYVGKLRKQVGEKFYEKLLDKRRNRKNNSDPFDKQIELDLLRTLPTNQYFESAASEGIPKLRNVLLAYSQYNPQIGYCQGMNRLAAFSLLFLSEEDSFWCLVAIINYIMPRDYFSKTMIGALADQRVLREILLEKVPRVCNHIDSLEMDLSLFSFNWFLTLFIENIPINTVLRIWDCFLNEGCKILFRFAVTIFKSSEDRIIACTDYITANQFLRELGSQMSDSDRLTEIAFTELNPFPIRKINKLRQHFTEQVKTELRELNALRDEFRTDREPFDYYSSEDEDTQQAIEQSNIAMSKDSIGSPEQTNEPSAGDPLGVSDNIESKQTAQLIDFS